MRLALRIAVIVATALSPALGGAAPARAEDPFPPTPPDIARLAPLPPGPLRVITVGRKMGQFYREDSVVRHDGLVEATLVIVFAHPMTIRGKQPVIGVSRIRIDCATHKEQDLAVQGFDETGHMAVWAKGDPALAEVDPDSPHMHLAAILCDGGKAEGRVPSWRAAIVYARKQPQFGQ